MRAGLQALSLVLLMFVSGARADNAPLPLEAFVAAPKIVTPTISPNGRYLAFARNDASATVVAVIDLDAPGTPPAGLTMPAGSEAVWISWKGSNRVLAMLSPAREFKMGQGERLVLPTAPRIVAFDKDGKNFKTLFDLGKRSSPSIVQILRAPLENPDYVLMGLYDPSGRIDLHRVNVQTGDTEKIETGNKSTAYWLTDLTGRPRARIDGKYDGVEMWVRRGDTDQWDMISRYNERGSPKLKIVGFSDDPTVAIVSDRGSGDRFGLYEYNMRSRTSKAQYECRPKRC